MSLVGSLLGVQASLEPCNGNSNSKHRIQCGPQGTAAKQAAPCPYLWQTVLLAEQGAG